MQGEALSTRSIGQPISELDELRDSGKNAFLTIPFSQKVTNFLMKSMDVPLQPALLVPHTKVIGIVDSVRNKLLVWALELEQKGVVGEGMTFSKEEQTAAAQVTYQITNNIGSMSNSQLQQHSSGSAQSISAAIDLESLGKLVSSLQSASDTLSLSDPARRELAAEIQTLQVQSKSPKPKTTIISESMKSIRTILEGAAGNVLASDLVQRISSFLQNLT